MRFKIVGFCRFNQAVECGTGFNFIEEFGLGIILFTRCTRVFLLNITDSRIQQWYNGLATSHLGLLSCFSVGPLKNATIYLSTDSFAKFQRLLQAAVNSSKKLKLNSLHLLLNLSNEGNRKQPIVYLNERNSVIH